MTVESGLGGETERDSHIGCRTHVTRPQDDMGTAEEKKQVRRTPLGF